MARRRITRLPTFVRAKPDGHRRLNIFVTYYNESIPLLSRFLSRELSKHDDLFLAVKRLCGKFPHSTAYDVVDKLEEILSNSKWNYSLLPSLIYVLQTSSEFLSVLNLTHLSTLLSSPKFSDNLIAPLNTAILFSQPIFTEPILTKLIEIIDSKHYDKEFSGIVANVLANSTIEESSNKGKSLYSSPCIWALSSLYYIFRDLKMLHFYVPLLEAITYTYEGNHLAAVLDGIKKGGEEELATYKHFRHRSKLIELVRAVRTCDHNAVAEIFSSL
ncbi:MAG: hypothetical protein D6769_02430 [Methanobacteriota archaeon]|nr:MAG: hypothetical protein D6769_02430 [Euryarchaeota archaeon]